MVILKSHNAAWQFCEGKEPITYENYCLPVCHEVLDTFSSGGLAGGGCQSLYRAPKTQKKFDMADLSGY